MIRPSSRSARAAGCGAPSPGSPSSSPRRKIKYREQEAELARRVGGLEERARTLVQEAGVRSLGDLPRAAQQQVRQTRLELLPLRKGLRDIRRRIRGEVDRLGRTLTVLNLLAWTGLVVLLWAAVFALRRRRHGATMIESRGANLSGAASRRGENDRMA